MGVRDCGCLSQLTLWSWFFTFVWALRSTQVTGYGGLYEEYSPQALVLDAWSPDPAVVRGE